jgi:hypothetical protein
MTMPLHQHWEPSLRDLDTAKEIVETYRTGDLWDGQLAVYSMNQETKTLTLVRMLRNPCDIFHQKVRVTFDCFGYKVKP